MSEIDKLEEYLKTHGYNYERIKGDPLGDMQGRNQIIVYGGTGKRLWDAICHTGSYGYFCRFAQELCVGRCGGKAERQGGYIACV